MTRILLLALALFSFAADAQQYVRPSKGTSFSPFPDTGIDGGWYVPTPTIGVLLLTPDGPVYDWSSFEAARIRIYSATDGVNPLDGGLKSDMVNSDGLLCSQQSLQYSITDIGSFLRFRRLKVGLAGWFFDALDAPTVNGPFVAATTANNVMSLNTTGTANFVNCYVRILVTPIPFAPPSIAGTTTVTLPDGGIVVNVAASSTAPYMCGSSSRHTTVYMDGGSQNMGTMLDGSGKPTSLYAIVCNAKDNTATDNVRCRDDATAPILDAGSPGIVLGVGDCVPFTSNTAVTLPLRCIGTSNWVNVFECAP